jgi:hypothetical protein
MTTSAPSVGRLSRKCGSRDDLLQGYLYLFIHGRTPWAGDQPVAGNDLEQYKQNKRTDIHASSGTRTHDRSVRVGEDILCIRPRGHRDRHHLYIL